MPSLSSPPFARLVAALKKHKKTCTLLWRIDVINASLLAQPGASAVYFGGSVAYNTRRAKSLLLNSEPLHHALLSTTPFHKSGSKKEQYIQSKLEWTRQTCLAFCQQVGTDLCISEGGATGPTFRPEGLTTTGFAAIAIAARSTTSGNGGVEMVQQQVVESTHANRQANMRLFADRAAELALQVVLGEQEETITSNNNDEEELQLHTHLDRATHLRSDPERLARLAGEARYVVLHGGSALFQKQPEESSVSVEDQLHNRELSFLTQAQVQTVCDSTKARMESSFLGLVNNGTEPIFGVDLLLDGDSYVLEEAIQNQKIPIESHFEDVRTVAPLLNPDLGHNEMVLHATALAQWQRRAPHCTVCGSTTQLLEGGTSRVCTGCGHLSWPRQDPSMIVAVSSRNGEKILLGRSRRHPAKMYTALAGFVEAGETLERAVAREVYEETGIRIDADSVQYVASQPWPFPQSTMMGFTCRADCRQPLNIDTNELVDAQWFDPAQVERASQVRGPVMQKEVADAALFDHPELSLLIPPKGVLARSLIDKWLEG